MSSDSLKGNSNVQVSGFQEQYINLSATKNVDLLKGSFNISLSGDTLVELKGQQGLYVVLIGSSYIVNLSGSVGKKLANITVLSSSNSILSSDTLVKASSG